MNLFTSFMRTVVPIVAGLVLTLLVHIGVQFGSASVASVVTTVLTGAYYTVFRLLENLALKIRSRPLATVAGILLGWATPPDYPTTGHRTAPAPATATATDGRA
ncbi:hypothetical protein [Streptomyces sp. GbtcB6]|uniref:hypothetical protein n=1 Tax=Streptomyces sp. GbtcB6 TaxID=2824751 RepID=UPI001C2FCB53|nr:hypothetical protein [Streptomyces sp. GbtcB6]